MNNTISLITIGAKKAFPANFHQVFSIKPEIVIRGSGRDMSHGLTLLRQHTPTIAMIGLPVIAHSTLAMLGRIQKSSPRTRVMIVAPEYVEEHVTAAFNAGCAGFILTECS